MNKIYQQHNNSSHRSNVAQGSSGGAGANNSTARVVGPQNAVVTAPPTATQPTNNVPNNNNNNNNNVNNNQNNNNNNNSSNHGHHHNPPQHHHQQQQQQQHQQPPPQQQQQGHHHPRQQHGHNMHQHHQHHHHHHHQQQQHQHHHHQPQQQQPPTPQTQQQQQQSQQQHHHHHQQQQQQQHHHHHHNPHPQNPAYMPHSGAHIAHDVMDHHLPPQVAPNSQQVPQQGPGAPVPPPPLSNQPQQQPQQTNQHNPVVKHHHQQTQQTSMASAAQMHQSQTHHHNHHHHSQHPHHHPLHHPQQMPISPSMPPQQQWVGPHPPQQQSSQASQHHHPQQQPPPVPQPSQHPQQQPPPPSASQQQPQQHQQPPPPPPQQQPPPHHHMAHPQAPPMMINQQYPNPNFLYSQMGPPFVPQAGHVTQYDHSPATSHQSDAVNINSQQQQQPVSINNHHPGNMPLTQMPTVISTAATGTTNIHQINNGPMMDPHMSHNRMPLNQQAYIMANPYLQSPFNLMLPYPVANLGAYPGGHMPPHNPAMIPPLRVPGDISMRPHFDPQNSTATLPAAAALSQPPSAKPPVTVTPAASMPPPVIPQITPIKPREKKVLAIVDPVTKHVFSEAELKGSPTTPQSQLSRDSSAPRIFSHEQSVSDKESLNEEAVTKSVSDSTTSDMPFDEPLPVQEVSNVSAPKVEVVETEEEAQEPPKDFIEKKVVENGDIESLETKDEKNLTAEMATLSVSADDKPSDESELKETHVKKQLLPNLPYAAGQFSPLNPNGCKRYSIEFLRAVAKEMKIELDTSSAMHHRIDFVPHYVNQGSGGANLYRDFSAPQPLMRRSSQQVINKPRKVINTTHSLQQEVELKTAEKPWKPELETEKPKIVEGAEMDTRRLLKVFRGHLNKLTPQKYDSLIVKIGALDLNGTERLSSVIDLVFDKAVDEPGFCELYAKVCKVIAAKDADFSFHLVKKCQDEFETPDLYDGLNVEDRKAEIEKETQVVKKKMLYEELYEDMRLRRKKYLGTIKLIGEMYKLGLLSPKIIGICMAHLIGEASNENIECLCSLIATVGFKMANEPDESIKNSINNTLKVLHDFASSKKTNELFTLESRIKFKILDTIDLSKRNWRPRMVENNPKKIEEIREEAKEEQMRQQHQNHSIQSKNLLKPDDRDRFRRTGNMNYAFKPGKY